MSSSSRRRYNMGMTIGNGAREVSDKFVSWQQAAGILRKVFLMGARGTQELSLPSFRGFSKRYEELTGEDLLWPFSL